MTREEFNNQSLPKSDENANLETLSRNKLKLMFSHHDFELRDELQHDKGIDLFIEIKSNGKSTNLRFPVQLKATQSLEKNQDGSISFPIRITNINYLMNDGLPAFYIVYNHAENIFYYERAEDVEKALQQKYVTTEQPEHFTFRFSKELDTEAVENIHDEMLSRGFLRRSINRSIQLTEDNTALESTIVVRKNQEVYSASENIRFLEKYGYRLLNSGRFSEILSIETKCYPVERTSPFFHFVCGTAAHYVGNLYKALEHFKQAGKDIDALHPEVQNMMQYYTVHSKRALGMLDKEKISGYIEALMNSDYLGLYLRLQKAFEEYYISEDPEAVKLTKLRQVVNSVLADPNCNESLRLIADSYLLSAEGHRLNDQWLDHLLLSRGIAWRKFTSVDQYKRKEQVDNYNRHFNELKAKALKDSNQFTYHNVCLNGVKIQYIKTFYADIIMGTDRNNLTIKSDLDEPEKELLAEQAEYVGKIAEVYEQVGISENMIAALSQQYELLHFLQDFEKAERVLQKIERIVADNDWHGLEAKVQYLRNGGTSHETFAKMVISSFSRSNERENEHRMMKEGINEMNMKDIEKKGSTGKNRVYFDVFPLGIFYFEEAILDQVFDVLHATPEARAKISHIRSMKVIPIINIFNDPVVSEGPAGGFFHDKGGDSLVRMYQVRKGLREVGAYIDRIKLSFG
jgi:hypothetical protein